MDSWNRMPKILASNILFNYLSPWDNASLIRADNSTYEKMVEMLLDVDLTNPDETIEMILDDLDYDKCPLFNALKLQYEANIKIIYSYYISGVSLCEKELVTIEECVRLFNEKYYDKDHQINVDVYTNGVRRFDKFNRQLREKLMSSLD